MNGNDGHYSNVGQGHLLGYADPSGRHRTTDASICDEFCACPQNFCLGLGTFWDAAISRAVAYSSFSAIALEKRGRLVGALTVLRSSPMFLRRKPIKLGGIIVAGGPSLVNWEKV